MKVSEFVELLKKYPQDAPVAYTYETVVDIFDEDEVYMSADGVLMIGLDYKGDFESGKRSAR